MNYYIDKKLPIKFDTAVRLIKEALKNEGFSVVTEFNMDDKLKEDLGIEFRRIKIISVCISVIAYKSLLIDDKIGVLLPCNIMVQEQDNGDVEIVTIDPVTTMKFVEDPELSCTSYSLQEKLKSALHSLEIKTKSDFYF